MGTNAIGLRLRRWRERRGLTQRIAAATAGLSQSAWCLYETGRKIPRDPETVEKLIRVTSRDPKNALTLSMFARAHQRRREERASTGTDD